MFSRVALIGTALVALAITAASRNAHAYPFYIDFQAGTGRYSDTDNSLFNSGTAGSSNFGMSFNLGFFYTPIEPRGGFDFQIGLENVYLISQLGNALYYSTDAPYLVARAQLWMFYGSAGIAPLIWERGEAGPGADFMHRASNVLGYFAEVGALYAATPKFSMGGSVNFQFFSCNGVLNPSPNLSLNFVMRFYFSMFGIGQDGPGQASPLEFNGWRYIGR